MTQDHIDRAVRESCPANKTTCAFVALGCCPAVEIFRLGHGSWIMNEFSVMPALYRDQQPVVRVNL